MECRLFLPQEGFRLRYDGPFGARTFCAFYDFQARLEASVSFGPACAGALTASKNAVAHRARAKRVSTAYLRFRYEQKEPWRSPRACQGSVPFPLVRWKSGRRTMRIEDDGKKNS